MLDPEVGVSVMNDVFYANYRLFRNTVHNILMMTKMKTDT